MKFHRPLQKATFLRRKCDSIIEVDVNTVKTALYCPNSSLLKKCAVLGSNIWFSLPIYTPFYVPATWQLAEVDFGNLVLINNKLCTELFLEGLKTGAVRFNDASFNKVIIHPKLSSSYEYDYNLTDGMSKFYLNIVSTSEKYFPEARYTGDSLEAKQGLYDLIHAKMLGHRAALCCFTLNNNSDQLFLTDKYDPEYAHLLNMALKQGVEFYGYQLNVTDSEIKVGKAIAIKQDFKLLQ